MSILAQKTGVLEPKTEDGNFLKKKQLQWFYLISVIYGHNLFK
jgi:hypothetical protein